MKTLSLKSLLPAALAVGAMACSLDPPTPGNYEEQAPTCNTTPDAGTEDDAGSAAIVEVTPVSCNASNASLRLKYTEGYTPSKADLDIVKGLMGSMSLADKAWQMRGTKYGAAGQTQMSDTQRSYDVPLTPTTPTVLGYTYRDASRGVNFAEDMKGQLLTAGFEPGTKTPVGWSTAFPVSMARGAAFDLDLEFAIGEAIGDEMMAAQETLLLAPCMNVLRHPLWGRAQETYGEDSFHVGRLATAMTVGLQQHIAANAKHYLAYNIENGRDQNNMTLDEQTMRETYGRHFRMTVQDGGVASVMAAYNRINGEKATTSSHILNDILRTDFGFQGFVLSDWWAMDPQLETNRQTSYYAAQAIKGVRAGMDVELPWSLNYAYLESIVQTGGGLTQADIDRSAERVLLQKVRFRSWDPAQKPGLGTPKTKFDRRAGKIVYQCDGHVDLARKAALESMVLLKNSGNTLPISSSAKKVAVLGAVVPYQSHNNVGMSVSMTTSASVNFAEDVRTGDLGSSRAFSDPKLEIGPLKGITNTAPAGVTVVTSSAPIGTVTAAQNIGSDSNVSSADFIVVIAGLTPQDEGEEYTKAGDRTNFALDAKVDPKKYPGSVDIQNTLIKAAAALGKPMVVILEGGSIIDVSGWKDQVPALVMAWYPGMVGGDAMGRLLWGQFEGKQYNFSGKLPFTWSQLSDFPEFKGASGTTNADYFLGYRLFDKNNIKPEFPFGAGLSYTTFEYSKLQIGCTDVSQGGVIPVYVNVKNTGDRPGDEVVFLFASFPNSKATRRTTIRELKGFTRVSLAPGEEKQVLIPVRLKDLDYYDQEKGKWVVEDGAIKIMVGGDPSNSGKMLTGSVDVHGYEMASSNY
jgi:beta-glucosidase